MRSGSRHALLVLFLCLPLSWSAAQHQAGNVHVYVTYPDDRAVTAQVKVGLIGATSGAQVEELFTNDRGEATFLNVPLGNYHVSVNGEGIQPTQSDSFEVDERKSTQSVLVRVRPAAGNVEATQSSGATVSANDLKVPQKASKEREALQKAIAADGHFAPALVNLARLEMKGQNFAAAETNLNQATAADPTNARSLALLAQVQLLDRHYEDAIASAGKVHAMSHPSYAVVHYVAARACERLNRLPDAVSQFNLFLAEEPTGDRANAARQEMAAIQKQLQ